MGFQERDLRLEDAGEKVRTAQAFEVTAASVSRPVSILGRALARLLDARGATRVRIAPDESWLCYVTDITGTPQLWRVPTEAMRNGDFRELIDSQRRQIRIYNPYSTNPNTWQRDQFAHNGQPNVIDPRLISPLAKYLFSITPMPTSPANPMLEPNWIGPVPGRTRSWTTTTRIDHRFSDKDQFYARYTQGDYSNFSQFFSQPMLNNVAGTTTTLSPNKNLAMSWVRSFSPTFFNELLVSGARERWWKGTGDPTVKYADQLGLPNPLDVVGWPGLYDGGLGGDYYFETDNTQAGPQFYVIADNNATKIHGRHKFQFGFHFRYDQMNLLPDQQQNQGNHSWATGATSSRRSPYWMVSSAWLIRFRSNTA